MSELHSKHRRRKRGPSGLVECHDKDCVHHQVNDNHNVDPGPYCSLDECVVPIEEGGSTSHEPFV